MKEFPVVLEFSATHSVERFAIWWMTDSVLWPNMNTDISVHCRTPGVDQKKLVEKKKKKRKPRLPKDYNPAVTPDPERWLPRWQRKGYRKKKDRRVKEVMKGTQGVSSEAADKL